jgi:hypothetical protein
MTLVIGSRWLRLSDGMDGDSCERGMREIPIRNDSVGGGRSQSGRRNMAVISVSLVSVATCARSLPAGQKLPATLSRFRAPTGLVSLRSLCDLGIYYPCL